MISAGNHDSWPYTKYENGTFSEHPTPDGDQAFVRTFGDIFLPAAAAGGLVEGRSFRDISTEDSVVQVSGFANSTCPNGDFAGVETYHTNFEVR
jgi:hypothetical protein